VWQAGGLRPVFNKGISPDTGAKKYAECTHKGNEIRRLLSKKKG
jgi:hypothetical protein